MRKRTGAGFGNSKRKKSKTRKVYIDPRVKAARKVVRDAEEAHKKEYGL